MRVADADGQAGAVDRQVLRRDHRLTVEHDEGAEVGLEALGGAGQIPHSAPGADHDRLALGQLDQPVLDEEAAEHPDAVAAHLGRASVGVVVVHEPLGGRILGQRLGSDRELRRPHRADDPVRSHPEVTVRDAGEGVGIQLDLALGVGEQHEVVAGAVALGEVECRAHGFRLSSRVREALVSIASASATRSGSSELIHWVPLYRPNHPTCRRA